MACRLDLPIEFKHVHNVFYISQLRKYVSDSNHVIMIDPVEVAENLMYVLYKYYIIELNNFVAKAFL